jgi:hypothetical protein
MDEKQVVNVMKPLLDQGQQVNHTGIAEAIAKLAYKLSLDE